MLKALFRIILLPAVFLSCSGDHHAQTEESKDDISKPNVILIMADDLGWGDTGYNGHPHIQTPHLDDMASKGITFERFYAAAPVCSPTRGSCLTGRNPFRYGIFSANHGHLPEEEITLAELLRDQGYRTGHFGKWHLGTLTVDTIDANRGGREMHRSHYSPPSRHGFDVYFSTESKVPTWDPMLTPEKQAGGVGSQGFGNYFGTAYWDENGQRVTENLQGDNSRVIMDRVLPFIEESARNNQPFFAVVWFHSPHTPVVAGDEYLDLYKDLPANQQHYYGCVTAMDEQIGRLRDELKALGVHHNTLTFFTSDNGPENNQNRPRSVGITNGLSERKRGLKEGGIRVPGLAEFPDALPGGITVSQPYVTSDYLPTVMDLLGLSLPDDRPLDGVSMVPVLTQRETGRRDPMVFRFQQKVAVIDGDWKIYRPGPDSLFALYHLVDDPAEETNLASIHSEKMAALQAHCEAWQRSQEASLTGADYKP
ncbi:MAG: sulfatase-like hydrolase/transferase [Bacteroidota bacterium]